MYARSEAAGLRCYSSSPVSASRSAPATVAHATTRVLDTMIETTAAELARVYQWPTTAARAALHNHLAPALACSHTRRLPQHRRPGSTADFRSKFQAGLPVVHREEADGPLRGIVIRLEWWREAGRYRSGCGGHSSMMHRRRRLESSLLSGDPGEPGANDVLHSVSILFPHLLHAFKELRRVLLTGDREVSACICQKPL